ncbi:hypothetical protein SMACR_03262 [Sordaria macrospora]|uniref:WGS project CABT00000000 data, contig 2.10 n=2 Tax=Sordaria macrospora TaxID=5147 RepID=F7VWD4_SORMK|nr:uncharacterized protein SMAC_03262 [Sordaria macrospora k-hell]KAA8635676.1 hypothetical protein SMACR_03262 [Sordaria macrospora]WPJ66781.1 hypothetical protein SMAC4_03262 [Sordaria macrospora]CCC09702.1 unnamed protein product [Sordaria macrospora k-hell]
MRRTVIAARSSAGSLARAVVYQQHFQPRRMFATSGSGTAPPSKSEPPTTPVDRSQDQAHPIGAYYEGVLNGSKNYPDTKPELPPVTSQKYPTKLTPAEPEAKPEPEPTKPKQDDNVSSAPTPTPSEQPPKKEGEQQQQPPVKQEQKEEEKKPASATTTSATPADEPSQLESAKKTDEKGDEAIIAIAMPATSAPTPVPARRAAVVRKPRELKTKKKDPKEAKEPKVVNLASAAQRAERLASIRSQSKLVAGVLVPPRPEEPDNCCMSGCVNCVWDLYRDEMEAWATATAEAEQRLAAQQAGLGEEGAVAVTGAVEAVGSQQSSTSSSTSTSTSTSPSTSTSSSTAAESVKGTELAGTAHSVVDQRGASSATGAGASTTKTSTSTSDTTWNDDLYKNVPVGIREFMKQEKRLKEKHAREGTVGYT